MSLTLTGSTFESIEDGVHEVTIGDPERDIVGQIYYGTEYGGEPGSRDKVQCTLIYDSGDETESGDPMLVFDSFITWSANERAKLMERLRSVMPNLDPADVSIEPVFAADSDAEAVESKGLEAIPHRMHGKLDLADILVDGESIKGRTLIITTETNAAGYSKVVSSSGVPVRKSKRRKAAAEEVDLEDLPA